MEAFIVKHYQGDDRPSIKGNGFDGLEIGQDREEAEQFIAFVNAALLDLAAVIAAAREQDARVCDRYPVGVPGQDLADHIRALQAPDGLAALREFGLKVAIAAYGSADVDCLEDLEGLVDRILKGEQS